jgi:quinol monooxygenase YgiN
MATSVPPDGTITVVVHMRLKPGCSDRFFKLLGGMMDHINEHEPASNIEYDVFRNNSDENECTFVQT